MTTDPRSPFSGENGLCRQVQSLADPVADNLLAQPDRLSEPGLVAIEVAKGEVQSVFHDTDVIQDFCDTWQQEYCESVPTRVFVEAATMEHGSPKWMAETRKARGWSQATLAAKAKELAEADGFQMAFTQQTIGNYEAEKTKKVPQWLRYALQALDGAPMAAPRDQIVSTEVMSAGIVGAEIQRAAGIGQKLKPLPVYGTALGGVFDDLDDVELVELQMSQVLEYLARPTSLANDKDAYVITVLGDSMMPRFRPGRRLVVSPLAPIGMGDDVIVQLRGHADGEERVTMVLVKELVRRTASFVELRQYNPDTTFRIPKDRVAHMHKVVGEHF